MVARCLPVFKVSASLIMPPPLLGRLTRVLFPSALTPHTHPRSFAPGLSLHFRTVCHPAAFPAGFMYSLGSIGTTLAKRRAILLKSLHSKRVGGVGGMEGGNWGSCACL